MRNYLIYGLVAAALSLPMAASADWNHDHGYGGWHNGGYHHDYGYHEGWNYGWHNHYYGYYRPYPGVYAYAPAPVYVAPVFGVPSASIDLSFPLR